MKLFQKLALISFAILFLILSGGIAFTGFLAYAQDSTSVPDASSILGEHVVAVILVIYSLYEIVVRLYPTVGNYSILSKIMKLLAFLVPNNKAVPNTEEVEKHEEIS